MTTVYELCFDSESKYCGGLDSTQDDSLLFLEGKQIGQDWTPIDVKLIPGKDPAHDVLIFAPGFGLTKRAVEILSPLIGENVEFLPLISKDGQFYTMNVINVVHALDIDRSKLERFEKSGKVMIIDEYVFHKDRIEDQLIFKIPEQIRSRVYVTDRFRDAVEKAGLGGFRFKQLWVSS